MKIEEMLERISVNAQNSIKINASNVIYFDPYLIEERTGDADYIFLTHDHYDHFSLDSINNILQQETRFIVPLAMDKRVRKNTPVGINMAVEPGMKYETDDFTFETVPMYNIRKPFHLKSGGWCGYVVNVDDVSIYVAGDIDAIKEAKNIKCDIALIPIGGFYTMDYKKAAELINVMRPKAAIPTHYGTAVGSPEDGEKFKALVDDEIQVYLKL